jgi:hypothetical protein
MTCSKCKQTIYSDPGTCKYSVTNFVSYTKKVWYPDKYNCYGVFYLIKFPCVNCGDSYQKQGGSTLIVRLERVAKNGTTFELGSKRTHWGTNWDKAVFYKDWRGTCGKNSSNTMGGCGQTVDGNGHLVNTGKINSSRPWTYFVGRRLWINDPTWVPVNKSANTSGWLEGNYSIYNSASSAYNAGQINKWLYDNWSTFVSYLKRTYG